MITDDQYFGGKPHTLAHEEAACLLLMRVYDLQCEFRHATGRHQLVIDPDTGTEISGTRGGTGDGGFRTPASRTGAPNSAHREARAVDPYDPENALDDWLTTYDREGGMRNAMLEKYKLYREHPSATPTWCHLTTRAPLSGRRTYYP